MGGDLSPGKAGEILHDGSVRGHALTDRQRRFMGWVAGGRKKRKGGRTSLRKARSLGRL